MQTYLEMKGGRAVISIIVPIYNIFPYLRQCIESILCQTYADIEIVLVDDGSADGCYEICEEYRKRDSRIVVIHKENGGLVSARKAGIRAASGDYIAYVDGDDWIEPEMYEKMYRRMAEQKVDIVMCGRYEDTGKARREVFHGVPEGRHGKGELLRTIYQRMIVGDEFFEWQIFPGLWDKLFRREAVERFQMAVDERITMGEDAACVYSALLHADSIYVMHECLYHYRQTTSSMVKTVQNHEKEREQFGILYASVNQCFEKDKNIFDLREQWLKYVLFLMIPRADSLYRGYDAQDFLFPFSGVPKGSDIILYGAGTYGQRLYAYLKRTGFCKVVLWLDRNYEVLRKMGLEVQSPEELGRSACGIVVIANTYARSRKGLYEGLARQYPEKKICMIDEDLIFSDKTKGAFGLNSYTRGL